MWRGLQLCLWWGAECGWVTQVRSSYALDLCRRFVTSELPPEAPENVNGERLPVWFRSLLCSVSPRGSEEPLGLGFPFL